MVIWFDFGDIRLRATLRQTATADAIAAALPLTGQVATWGEEIYFAAPLDLPLESDARDVVEAGEIAFWPDGRYIAIGFGPTPASQGEEIRLAAPVNLFADAIDDVRALSNVAAGTPVKVHAEG